MTPEEICKLLYDSRFTFSNEKELQESIAVILPDHEREVVLTPRDRIDFMVGKLGIEVKVDGSLASVTRQLWRYTALDEVEGIILVTSKARHILQPSEMQGKPVWVVHLLNSSF